MGFTQDRQGLIGHDSWGIMPNRQNYFCDLATGKRLPLPEPLTTPSRWILTEPAKKSILTIDVNTQAVTVHDWPSGQPRRTFEPPKPESPYSDYKTNAAALAADGRIIAAVGEDRNQSVRGRGWITLFDSISGSTLASLATSDAIYGCVAIAPDNGAIAVAGSTMSSPTPIGVRCPQEKGPQALALIDTASGELIRTFTPPGLETEFRYIASLAFSPNGRMIAAPERDNHIWVYEVATGQVRTQLVGHSNQVTSMVFTSDSRRLVSVSRDLTGLVWDVSFVLSGAAGTKLVPAAYDRIWADIAMLNWDVAGRALETLAAFPDDAVALMRDRLRPASGPTTDSGTIDRLVRLLDSDQFAEREQATSELRRLGRDALPQLRRRAKEATSAEVQQRLKKLVKELAEPQVPAETCASRVPSKTSSTSPLLPRATCSPNSPRALPAPG
jgi:WD40 repeat protein